MSTWQAEWPDRPLSELKGLTIQRIDGAENGSDLVEIETTKGRRFRMKHDQDCCESVALYDVCGDPQDLVGSPIVLAEESTSGNDPPDVPQSEFRGESTTWTFYRIGTVKGTVVLRWLGESNGYYSERVDFEEWVGP